MYLLAVVEPVQECDLDLGAELISGLKSFRWNNGDQQRRHIVVQLVAGIDEGSLYSISKLCSKRHTIIHKLTR